MSQALASVDKAASVENYIMHHVANNFQEWHLPFGVHLPLSPFFSLHAVMLVLCAFFLIITFCGIYDKSRLVPQGITNFLEVFIVFIRDEISTTCFGKEEGRKMTPLLCHILFFHPRAKYNEPDSLIFHGHSQCECYRSFSLHHADGNDSWSNL